MLLSAVVLVLAATCSGSGLECYNGDGSSAEVGCEEEVTRCWSNSGKQFGCGECPQPNKECSECSTDRCNVPPKSEEPTSEGDDVDGEDGPQMSGILRWLILLLFFVLAAVIGLVVLVHIKRTGCKWGADRDDQRNDGFRSGGPSKKMSVVPDRDINSWKDLDQP